jgi:hypothetical protein
MQNYSPLAHFYLKEKWPTKLVCPKTLVHILLCRTFDGHGRRWKRESGKVNGTRNSTAFCGRRKKMGLCCFFGDNRKQLKKTRPEIAEAGFPLANGGFGVDQVRGFVGIYSLQDR